MKGLIQRVSESSVSVKGDTVGAIGQGILLLLGVEKDDDQAAADKLLQRVLNYRIFSDSEGKMNLSVKDIKGGVLVVSQFTLAAETRKGLRPGFSTAASPQVAEELYEYFVDQLHQQHENVATGIFAADMQVSIVNDGPVTFMLQA